MSRIGESVRGATARRSASLETRSSRRAKGGMIVTDQTRHWPERMRFLRGQAVSPDRCYWHTDVGFNYRMTNVAAAIGCAQMECIDDHLGRRQQVAQWYFQRLQAVPRSIDPARRGGRLSALLLDVLRRLASVVRRISRCRHAGPGGTRHRNTPRVLSGPLDAAVSGTVRGAIRSRKCMRQNGISLPTHGKLTEDDVDYVSQQLIQVVHRARRSSRLRGIVERRSDDRWTLIAPSRRQLKEETHPVKVMLASSYVPVHQRRWYRHRRMAGDEIVGIRSRGGNGVSALCRVAGQYARPDDELSPVEFDGRRRSADRLPSTGLPAASSQQGAVVYPPRPRVLRSVGHSLLQSARRRPHACISPTSDGRRQCGTERIAAGLHELANRRGPTQEVQSRRQRGPVSAGTRSAAVLLRGLRSR